MVAGISVEGYGIKHYSTCSVNYPEKPKGEVPKAVVVLDLGDGERVYQCSDCGAHILLTPTWASGRTI